MSLGNTLREFGVKVTLAFDKSKVDKAKKAINEVGKEMKGVAVQVAVASAALFEFANLASSNGRALQQNADALGINVERLQELEYAARVAAGVTREELMGALSGVSETLDKARHSDIMASEAFIRLGVPMQMITDKSVTADQVLLMLSDRFKSIQDPMAKMRLASEVGLSPKFLPLINKGSAGIAAMGKEARALGLVMSKEVIDKGAEFDRQFTKIWLVIKNITFTIGNEMIKYLGPIVKMFQQWIVHNKAFIATGIAVVMKSIGSYLQIVFTTLKFVIDRFMALVKVMGGVENVAKTIAVAFAIFTSLKIIAAVGTMVKSFQALAAVLGVISWESAAIGAALLALILVVQDLFSEDSIIKEWIKMFAEKFPNATKLFVGAFKVVGALVSNIASDFEALYDFIMGVVDAVIKFGQESGIFASIAEYVEEMIETFSELSEWAGKGMGAVGDFLEKVAEKVGYGASGAGETIAKNLTAKSSGASGSWDDSGGDQNNQFNANVTVMVPPGTSPGAAVAIAEGGVDGAFKNTMRQTKMKSIGGVAY